MSDPVFYVQHYAGRIKYNVSMKKIGLEFISWMMSITFELIKQA